jgi:hypothetical protein
MVPYLKMSSPGTMAIKPIVITSGSSGSLAEYVPPDDYYSPVFIFNTTGNGAQWTFDCLEDSEFGYQSSGS